MKIKSFVFNPFYENTYLLWDDTKEGIIVDPGCYESYERKEIIDFIESNQISIKFIVNTHCHIDHVLGNYDLKQHFKCPLWIPKGELEVFQSVVAYAPNWGITGYSPAEPDHLMEESDVIRFGETTLKSILCPGHSPGHLVFYHEKEETLIAGDVLFRESIGRTDLPGGNHQQLLDNIAQKIYKLPDDCGVYPGHGPSTTISHERQFNPFVRG